MTLIIKELKELNVKNILSYISEEDIYKMYLPKNFKFNVPFSSPFRVDNQPSFIIGGSNRYFRYKDFATGDTGNCFNFVKQLYNINFNECLIQIVTDFNLRSEFEIATINYFIQTKKAKYRNPSKTLSTGYSKIQIKSREFNSDDLEYWNSYGVDIDHLKLGTIVAISYFFINDICYRADRYAYAYIEKKDNKVTYKIYQPFSKYKKFISGNDYSVWELWNTLPETGDKLIITSSRKDALAIINVSGIPSVSFQAESIMPKEVVLKAILKRFKRVYLLYDNDTHKEQNNGQKMAEKLCLKYPELINIKIDDLHKAKDFSDLVKYRGKEKGRKVLNELIE